MRGLLFILFVLPSWVNGQGILSFKEYKQVVWDNHPLVKQADIAVRRGESNALRARGAFDPKIEATIANKKYNDKNYYNLQGAQLKIPTPFALEFKGTYDLNNGTYLDPSLNTSDQGLIAFGASLPLLQGLVFDERRAAKKLASAFSSYSSAEQQFIINDLLLNAYKMYWDWWANVEKEKLSKEIFDFTQQRFNNMRDRAKLGLVADFDTLESAIQKGVRQQLWMEAQTNEIKSRYVLSTMLWTGDSLQQPLYIDPMTKPEVAILTSIISPRFENEFLSLLDSIPYTHPQLQIYQAKLEMLETEIKWKKEKIKPKLNIHYNALTEPLGNGEFQNISTQNYKWGIDFAFPLLVREARGDMQMSTLKRDELQFEIQQKTQELKNKAWTAFQTKSLVIEQINTAFANAQGYYALLLGERIKFTQGESSLFLLNQREIQYAESQSKWIDLQLKMINLHYEMIYALGRLSDL
jgi:outer membrane protein TolC